MAEEKGADAIRDRNRRIREEAAEKRRTKREAEKVVARRPTLGQLEASEIMDDAFARTTHAVTSWVRRHFTVVQWVLVVGLAGGIGWQVYVHHRGKVEGRTTDALAAAVTKELGRVGDEPAEDDPASGLGDPRPLFKNDEERLRAAEAEYRKVSEGDTARTLARLGLAGVLFDQGKHKEALAEYRAVRENELAAEDADVRARTIEGIALSQEALGSLDDAKKTFGELVNQDSAAVSALGLYHQARIEKKQGNTDKAKDRLKAALKKIADNKLTQAYVEQASRELLGSIDPSAVPPPSPGSLTPEQREQLETLQKLQAMKKNAQQATDDVSPEALKKLVESIGKDSPPEPAPSAATPTPEAPAPSAPAATPKTPAPKAPPKAPPATPPAPPTAAPAPPAAPVAPPAAPAAPPAAPAGSAP